VLRDSDWRDDELVRLRSHLNSVLATPSKSLVRTVRSSGADLVHTNNLYGLSTAVWEASRQVGIPVVHTLHDYYLLCPRVTLQRTDGSPCRPHPLLCGLRTRRLARWGGAVSDVIVVSHHLWRQHRHLFPGARSHLVRLPLAPISDGSLAPPRTPPRSIGYLGKLEREKGIESLLSAAPALAELGCTLRVAGDGRLRSAVEAAAGEGVAYIGPVRGVAKLEFIETTDLAVVPSLWAEPGGPPTVVCEWLAAGRPVLASDRGGLAEVHNLPGVIPVAPKAASLIYAVRQLLTGTAWRDLLDGLSQVKDRADVERWLDEHEAVYRLASMTAP
jgi:glycosyltransferase involved in cell wall biosynthesis